MLSRPIRVPSGASHRADVPCRPAADMIVKRWAEAGGNREARDGDRIGAEPAGRQPIAKRPIPDRTDRRRMHGSRVRLRPNSIMKLWYGVRDNTLAILGCETELFAVSVTGKTTA